MTGQPRAHVHAGREAHARNHAPRARRPRFPGPSLCTALPAPDFNTFPPLATPNHQSAPPLSLSPLPLPPQTHTQYRNQSNHTKPPPHQLTMPMSKVCPPNPRSEAMLSIGPFTTPSWYPKSNAANPDTAMHVTTARGSARMSSNFIRRCTARGARPAGMRRRRAPVPAAGWRLGGCTYLTSGRESQEEAHAGPRTGRDRTGNPLCANQIPRRDVSAVWLAPQRGRGAGDAGDTHAEEP